MAAPFIGCQRQCPLTARSLDRADVVVAHHEVGLIYESLPGSSRRDFAGIARARSCDASASSACPVLY